MAYNIFIEYFKANISLIFSALTDTDHPVGLLTLLFHQSKIPAVESISSGLYLSNWGM